MHLEQSANFKRFLGQNMLGLDYGSKVIGLGFFCPGKDLAPWPYGRIIVKDENSALNELEKIVNQEEIQVLVIGVPLLLDGKETPMTRKIREFGQKLEQRFSTLSFFYQDETLSTYAAEEHMKNSPRYNFKVDPKQIDAVAASLILEDFIRLET